MRESNLETRLNDLEVKFAFQQETIDALNAAVTDQWAVIDRLSKAMQQLHDQLLELEDGNGSVDPGNIRPPHY